MPITHHVNDLVDKARETINQVSATEAARMFDADEALLIDIRESHELKDRGIIEEAQHAGILGRPVQPLSQERFQL